MSEIRQQIGAAFPRPRRSGGVVSYVAELQQLDEETGPVARVQPELPSGFTLEFEPVTRRGRRPEPRLDDPDPADGPAPDGMAPDGMAPDGMAPDGMAPDGHPPLRSAAPAAVDTTATRSGPGVPPVVRLADHMRLSDPHPSPGTGISAAGISAAGVSAGTGPGVVTGAAASPDAVRSIDGWTAARSDPRGPLGHSGTDAPTDELAAVPGPATSGPATSGPAEVPALASGRRRRVRLAVLAASTAVLTVAAVGYAVTDRSASTETTLPPSRFEVPAGDPPGGVDVGRASPQSVPASGSPSASSPATASAPVETSISAGPIVPSSVPSTAQVDPAASRSAGAVARPSAEATRTGESVGNPATSSPPVEQAPVPPNVADLTATFTRTANVLPLGLGGYVGTVRVSNPGGVDAVGWRMRLIVPGGNEVVPGQGVIVAQSGELVFFRPRPGLAAVPAGGSVTFTFTVNGVLVAEPAGCSIDGNPCD